MLGPLCKIWPKLWAPLRKLVGDTIPLNNTVEGVMAGVAPTRLCKLYVDDIRLEGVQCEGQDVYRALCILLACGIEP